jgi:hypothetical protein
MINSLNDSKILWRQVWGLAALLSAIIFSWTAYGFYQPQILQKLEFVTLASWLGIFQALLAAVVEPLIGGISDKLQQRSGSRLPIITVGVTLAGLIFVVVSLLVEQNLQGEIRWIVPVLMIAWVTAMIVFRGPAIALLVQLAPSAELPQANSILAFVLSLLGAIQPIVNVVLKYIGPSLTFMLGAISLLLGAYFLLSCLPKHSFSPPNLSQSKSIPKLLFILTFIIGMGAGLEVNLLMSIFPPILQTQLSILKPEFITSSILLVSAFFSIPLGKFTTKLGVDKSMLIGLVSIAALMELTLLSKSSIFAVLFILLFGISFSLVFVSMIPLALSMMSPSNAGLSTGLYFGGTGAATALVQILIRQQGIASMSAFILSAFAFSIVAFCIFISKKYH